MATKKTTTASKPRKTAVSGKTTASKKVTARKTGPTEELIRKKAEEIYHERLARGEHGTPEDDWLKAEKLLKG
jgi:hypothetical protein